MVEGVNGGIMRKLIALLLSTGLLVGCTSTSEFGEVSSAIQDSQEMQAESDTAPGEDVATLPEEPLNRWVGKCLEFDYESPNEWAIAYLQVIEDICATTEVNEAIAEIIYAPNVNPEHSSTKNYVETILFSQTFWSKYMTSPSTPIWVIATPEDEEWWGKHYDKYVTEAAEFTCPYFHENYFCSYKYYPPEGKTVVESEVHLFVVDQTEELLADAYVDPAHNAVHWYQDASGYQHWHEFLIEGHATLYEIAFHVLERSADDVRQAERQRESFAWLSHTLDETEFVATDAKGVLDHWDACYGRGYECNHYYYGGGAMFHERLILDYGYSRYLEWHENLASVSNNEEYFGLFEDFWGTSLWEFDELRFAPYAAESFNYYYQMWN